MKIQNIFLLLFSVIVLLTLHNCGFSTNEGRKLWTTDTSWLTFWGKPNFLDFGHFGSWKMEQEWIGVK